MRRSRGDDVQSTRFFDARRRYGGGGLVLVLVICLVILPGYFMGGFRGRV